MSEDLELTLAREKCNKSALPSETSVMTTFNCTLDPETQQKPKRERAKYFAVIVASDSQFDCVISAEDKKDLEKQIAKLTAEYDGKGMDFSIANIFKGHEVSFKETKAIEFL